MIFLEELVSTEVFLKKQQVELGRLVIICTIAVCFGIALLAIISGGLFYENAPAGSTARIILSEQFAKLIVMLSIPFIIGLTAGIILIKTSVKHIIKSYCNGIVSIENYINDD